MFIKKITLYTLLAVIVIAMPFIVLADGAGIMKNELVVVPQNETIDNDFFALGERVELSGTVNGDVYILGGEVLIDGTVNGDVLVAGGDVRIPGAVMFDVRVVGGSIVVSGAVGRNLSVAGGDIELSNGAHVQGNAVLAGGNVVLAGAIDGNVIAGAGQLVMSNDIGGNIHTSVGILRFTSGANIRGNVEYWSDEEVTISEGAVIVGNITRHTPRDYGVPREQWFSVFAQAAVAAKLISLLAALLVGLLLIKFFPHYTVDVVALMHTKTWPALGIGIAMLIGIPVFAIILIATIIGVPVGFILLALYIIAAYLAKVFFMLLVGTLLLRSLKTKRRSDILALIVGGVIYTLFMFIPFVGVLIALFALLTGLGAIAMNEVSSYKKARKAEIV